ncbi:MAG: mono/diheme cytochrome c family protein [Verrucomicrobiales bacterium]|jgi:mono/diheme cytochrome c family protein
MTYFLTTPKVKFVGDIKPIFQESCVHCHNGEPIAGRLNLKNRDAAFAGGASAGLIVPGSPETSRLYTKIKLADQDPGAMPPTGHALTDAQLKMIRTWIAQGAEWPSGPEGDVKPNDNMNWRSN